MMDRQRKGKEGMEENLLVGRDIIDGSEDGGESATTIISRRFAV